MKSCKQFYISNLNAMDKKVKLELERGKIKYLQELSYSFPVSSP